VKRKTERRRPLILISCSDVTFYSTVLFAIPLKPGADSDPICLFRSGRRPFRGSRYNPYGLSGLFLPIEFLEDDPAAVTDAVQHAQSSTGLFAGIEVTTEGSQPNDRDVHNLGNTKPQWRNRQAMTIPTCDQREAARHLSLLVRYRSKNGGLAAAVSSLALCAVVSLRL
jgi:hypothetical protein